MKIVSYVFLIFVLVNISSASEKAEENNFFPQKMTAKDLIMACTSSKMTSAGRQRIKYCSGFISGVEETARLLGKLSIKPKICLSEEKTSRQYADIYIRYASRKTTKLSKPAALVVVEAFQDAFPCPVTD